MIQRWSYASWAGKFSLERLSLALGVEVLDLDLVSALRGNDELAAATEDASYGALIDHQVLFFRNQPLTPEVHVRLGQLFGDLAPWLPVTTVTTRCPNTAMWQYSTGSQAIDLMPGNGAAI
jgi:alpha-ketoglutarate-dependent taurine dioxygenase